MSGFDCSELEGRSLEGYAAAVASASPAPGGGSVAANVAAFAASLCEMVCNLTLAGKRSLENPERLQSAARTSAELRARLLRLAVDDELAYARYRAAVAKARSTDEERRDRDIALRSALIQAADFPLETARTAVAVLQELQPAASDGTSHALSDVVTAAMLAQTAAKSSLLNVRVNADLMRDPMLAANYHKEAEQILADANAGAAKVISLVEARS